MYQAEIVLVLGRGCVYWEEVVPVLAELELAWRVGHIKYPNLPGNFARY